MPIKHEVLGSTLSLFASKEFSAPWLKPLSYYTIDKQLADNPEKGNPDHLFLYDLYHKLLHRGQLIFPSYGVEKLIIDNYGHEFQIIEDEQSVSSVTYTYNESLVKKYNAFVDQLDPWTGNSSGIDFDPNHPDNERRLFDHIIGRFGPKLSNCIFPQARIEHIVPSIDSISFLDQRLDFLISFPNGKSFIVEPGDHDSIAQHNLDESRDAVFRKLSIDTIRIDNNQIDSTKVLDKINDMILAVDGHQYLSESSSDQSALALKYLCLLPTLIARAESVLADILLRQGWLERDKITITVVEHDLHATEYILYSFFDHLLRFSFLYGITINLPSITVNISRDDSYKLSDISQLRRTLRDVGVSINEVRPEDLKKNDLLLDLAILSIHDNSLNAVSTKNTVRVRNSFPHNHSTELRYLSMPRAISEVDDFSHKFVLESFLTEIFRKYSFRSGQLPIVQRVLQQKSTIGLLPTSAGKSICYQLTALITPGTTIVVDPIVALMQDQVQGLQEQYLISNVFAWHAAARVKDEDVGQLLLTNTIIFMSPERLLRPGFRNAMRSLSAADIYINYAVIDEAHCVSMWGHDFRPSYLSLDRNFKQLCTFHGHEPITVALTGTASQLVLIDLKRELNIGDMSSIIRPKTFDRPELTFNIVECNNDDKEKTLATILGTIANRLGLSNITEDGYGIIFSYTPNEMWKLFGKYSGQDQEHVHNIISNDLDNHVKYGAYSGSPPRSSGISTQDWTLYKQKTLKAFKQGHINMLFGNTAIGVGIDNEQLNYVVNYRMPQSIEAYYQQSGRAGRNKQASECYLIYSDDYKDDTQSWVDGETEKMRKRWDDLGTVSFFHQSNFPGKDVDRKGALLIAKGIFGNDVENGHVLLKYVDDRTERYISFWLMLGVLSDYEVSGIGYNTTFHLKRHPKIVAFLKDNDKVKLEAHLITSLQSYLSRYRPLSITGLREQIEHRQEKSLSNKILGFLIDFIYDQIGYQRREGIRTMVEFCNQEDTSPDALRRTIRAYFDFSEKFSEALGKMADLNPDINMVLSILKKIEGFDDVEHLFWETRRLLDERFRIDWALINLYSMLYRERGVSDTGYRLLERVMDSFDTSENSSIDKDEFLAHYFSFITTLDKLYGTNISLNIIGDICGYIYSTRGVESLSFINKLSISQDDKNHLQLLITNKQVRSLLDVTRYSRVIG